MGGNDDLIARLHNAERAQFRVGDWTWMPVHIADARKLFVEAATAIAERDATIERLTKERDSATSELNRIRDAIAIKGGTEHAPTEWAYKAAHKAWEEQLEGRRAAESRATTAERDLAEARAEVERLELRLRDAFNLGHSMGERFNEIEGAALTAKGGENAEG